MTIKDGNRQYLAEEVLEVRYKPKGAFISHAGELADYVVNSGVLPHWTLDTNRIDFRDHPDEAVNLQAFFSFKNLGFIAHNAPTENFFKDKCIQYWKVVSSNKLFPIVDITRIGVRKRCFVPLGVDFDMVEEQLFKYLCKGDIFDLLGAKRKDLQVIYDLTEKFGQSRLTIGPLHRGEAEKHFKFKSELFEQAGIYLDSDGFVENPKPKRMLVEDFVRDVSDSTWDRFERLLAKLEVR
ncbi:hypothetical protein PFX98_16270 [Paucibacter sediminis]|uniref:Uncharacterized protein n=1 Tax=Paucibacter sediminis TaxID=3019553 RepID=A0AA95SMR8_9BURK|nr:hypothetical protein [Paucibacter sp. S2-9]WIT10460.1 hypothetical protein PFX98_16270 [Paucibacter sp. S2-9]